LTTGGHWRASLLRRSTAGLIDAGVTALLGGAMSKIVLLVLGATGTGGEVAEAVRKLTLLGTHAAYCILLTAGSRQSTLGQRWLGLRTLGADGGQPTHAEAIGRWLAFVAAALPLGAGLLLAVGPARRPFQDRVSDSRVASARGAQAQADA
jgi:uncharacterized RDD family membrane protein YckC